MMRRAIEKLEALWVAADVPLGVRARHEGLPPAQTARVLRNVGLHASPALLEWFSWANGGPDRTECFAATPSGGLLSLEQATRRYTRLREIYKNYREDYPPYYFPIILDAGGCVVSLDTRGDGDDAPAWADSKLGFEGHPAPSFEAVVTAWRDMVDRKTLWIEDVWCRSERPPEMLEWGVI